MKKSLLIILAALFCISLAAQPQSKDWKLKNAVSKTSYRAPVGGANEVNASFTPTHRLARVPKGDANLSGIGETYYISQTNSASRNTINWSPDGKSCAASWTYGNKSNVRGTGLNYYDPATKTWGSAPTERVEQGTSGEIGSPGWGQHLFTENGECIVAHSAAAEETGGLVINYREKRGEDEWQQYVLHGPTLDNSDLTDIYWPTLVAVGNTIHMVCVTSNDDNVTYQGIWCRPIYYKSTDGGKTWTNPVIFADMPERAQRNLRGDGYVIAARENHIVFAYCDGTVGYMESVDGGDTWVHKSVYETDWDWDSDGQSGPCMYPASVAITIGDDDKVHLAFSTIAAQRDPGTQPNWWATWSLFCGLFTWNEGDATIQMDDFGLVADDEGHLLSWSYDTLPNFMDAPDLLGFDYFTFWNPELNYKDMIPDNYGNHGYITNPRLLAKGNKVYLMYSSIIEEPMISNSGLFIRGVFLTVSYDNGKTFNQHDNTSWLSYHPDLFWCSWENFEHTSDTTHNNMVLMIEPSECGYPSMATSIENNSLVFTWENDFYPFPGGNTTWVTWPFNMYSLILPEHYVPSYYNTQDVWRDKGDKIEEKEVIENLKVYPNPPTDGYAMIDVGTQNPFTLTVTNMMGQVMFTGKGQGANVRLNVSHYPAGIYIVNVRTAHASASQKLIVK